jgi:hypothetical protein
VSTGTKILEMQATWIPLLSLGLVVELSLALVVEPIGSLAAAFTTCPCSNPFRNASALIFYDAFVTRLRSFFMMPPGSAYAAVTAMS